MHKTLLG